MDLQNATTSYSSPHASSSNWNNKDENGYSYHKSSYQFLSSGCYNAFKDHSEDQLDKLLEDLKNEREHTHEIEIIPTSVSSKEAERMINEFPGSVGKITYIKKSSHESGSKPMPVEKEYVIQSHTSMSNEPSLHNRDEYQVNEVTHRPSRSISEKSFEKKKKMYDSKNEFENVDIIPSTDFTNLENIALSGDILPLPGTKVTTTVRTYTYEIPSELHTDNSNNRTLLYKQNNTIHRNDANQIKNSQKTPQTIMYNTESYTSVKQGDELPVVTSNTREIRDILETNNTRKILQPQDHNIENDKNIEGGSNKTYVYRINTTENVQTISEPKYDHNLPPTPNYMLPNTSSYVYHESSNTINTNTSPVTTNELSTQKPIVMVNTFHNDGYPTKNSPNTSSVVYKYSKTTANSHVLPNYNPSIPISQPAPFPVDEGNIPTTNGNPPQRVDDLMQSFANSDIVDKSDIAIPHRKRELETGVAAPSQLIPTINRAGKEVYYPPGHEIMLSHREEMAVGSAAGGRWAKGSGMYEYESGYKSKSKTKSGGAVVPVCLPLCCAMPCTIM